MSEKQIGYGLLALGILAVLVSILIDPIRGNDIYLATSQIIVLVVGAVVALVGGYVTFMRGGGPEL